MPSVMAEKKENKTYRTKNISKYETCNEIIFPITNQYSQQHKKHIKAEPKNHRVVH